MRNAYCLLLVVLSATFTAECAMADVDMDDLEVTIRVIQSGKEHAGDISHKLELPELGSKKAESQQQKESRGHGDHKDGLKEQHEEHESHGQSEQHDAHDGSAEHHGDAKEDHERAVEQYENSREERNKALEQREDLKDMLDKGGREDDRSGDSKGSDN